MPDPRFSRRWLLVGTGATALVGTQAWPRPVGATEVAPDALRQRMLAASTGPYVGYAGSSGRLGLPQLSELESAVALVTATTRIRAFVASPERFRVDELTPVGERGTYRLGGREYGWDFEFDQLTQVVGTAPLRLPRASDMLPPDLARRLLRLAPADPLAAIPAQRVAGRTAFGLRLSPADLATTIGRVDVWADAESGLPLRVEIADRLTPDEPPPRSSRSSRAFPTMRTWRPPCPPGPVSSAPTPGRSRARCGCSTPLPRPPGWPGATRSRSPAHPSCPASGSTGPGSPGSRCSRSAARSPTGPSTGAGVAGGVAVEVGRGRAVGLSTPLLSLAVLARGRRGTLLVGAVDADLLDQTLLELTSRRRV